MFADPAAAGRRSAELRGTIGNSFWGRSMRLRKGYSAPKTKPIKLCDLCKAEIGVATAKQIIRARLAQHDAQKLEENP